MRLNTFLLALMITGMVSAQESSFYDLKATTVDGMEYSFEQLKGKKVLIVNTASKCSLSHQIKLLQELQDRYADKGLVILAFPSDDFSNREHTDNMRIKEVYQKRFGVTYTIMQENPVIGKDTQPVFQWLTQKSKSGYKDYELRWNFHKFLIDENGHIHKFVEPMNKPTAKGLIKWIEG